MDNNVFNIINSSLIITALTIISSFLLKYINIKKTIKREIYKKQLFNFYFPLFKLINPLLIKNMKNIKYEEIILKIKEIINDKNEIYVYIDSEFFIMLDLLIKEKNYNSFNNLSIFIIDRYNDLKNKLLLPKISKEYSEHFYSNKLRVNNLHENLDIFILSLIVLIYSVVIINLIINLK